MLGLSVHIAPPKLQECAGVSRKSGYSTELNPALCCRWQELLQPT